jgi:hypothetical protein
MRSHEKKMSPVKLGAYLILGVIGIAIALKLITGMIGALLSLVLPIAVVAGIGLILYGVISGRPLGGGRRYLP